jgi:DNA-binding NarL/FixJ family response regulator
MRIRALIIDDEPPARQRLRRFLECDPDLELIGECDNGHAAVSAIVDERPDLVFLDVQIPELNGLEVIERVSIERMPVTIDAARPSSMLAFFSLTDKFRQGLLRRVRRVLGYRLGQLANPGVIE